MAVFSTLMVHLLCLVFCTLALEQPLGRRSKRDLMDHMFSVIRNIDKRLVAVEATRDNSTEEQLAQLGAKMEEEMQEKQQHMEERLQGLQDVTQRLESMVLELLSSKLESMITEILTSKMKASEEKVAELVEAKTNATEERLATLEASNTETQPSPAACKYQFLYQYEKEATHSSADLQWVTKLESELTRLQEKMSVLDKRLEDNDLSVVSLHNASVLAMEGVVRSMTELVATSEQNLQSIMQNATETLASMMSSSEAHMLSTTENNTAALTKVKQTTAELAIHVSAVEDEMRSVTERMTASEHVMSTMQNATEDLASMINVSKILLLAKADNNAAVFNASMARLEQITKELGIRISTVEDKLNNASSIHAEEMENSKAMLEDIKKATEELSAPLQYRRTCQDYYDDGHRTSGVYKLQLLYAGSLMEVYCEMSNGTGWVVFQRRQDGSVDFYRNWTSYEEGFGDLNGEFWLGNRNIHRLTSAGLTQLRVDLQAWNGGTAFASYSHFSVGDASSSYRLSVSGYSGTAGDSLAEHNNQKFSTHDQDNDGSSGTHCARDHGKGAWWYNNCDESNLNGQYGSRGSSGAQYILWEHWLGRQSLQRTELKLK